MWSEIIAAEPDLFIWTGDIIYGDSHDPMVLKNKYDKQKNKPGYQKLLQKVPVIGSWDDHDYGVNNGGKYFSKKEESKEQLLDFLDVDVNNPVRKHKGVYQSYIYGPNDRQVKIMLLDCRSFRDTVYRHPETKADLVNPDGDVLGEEQWKWLEKELESSKAKVNIIVSGIQVIASEHRFEKWANLPKARKRLFDLIASVKPSKTLFISGDRHIAELSKIDLKGLGYPLYDVTSSGLTHTWSEVNEEPNKTRVGELVVKKNFGLLRFDWSDPDQVKVSMEVKGKDGKSFLRKTLF